MAVESNIELDDADGWVQVTNADCTKITAIHRGGAEIVLRPTVGANPPAADDAIGLPIKTSIDGFEDGFLNENLQDLWIATGVNRVYARALGGAGRMFFATD
jgi:hypothetical protein